MHAVDLAQLVHDFLLDLLLAPLPDGRQHELRQELFGLCIILCALHEDFDDLVIVGPIQVINIFQLYCDACISGN